MATKRRKKGTGGYLRYANENRREKNKARRIARHMARHPADAQSTKREAGCRNAGNIRRAANIARHRENSQLRHNLTAA